MKQQKNKQYPTLKLSHISKNYDKCVAVDDISFETYQGEIVALLGPNGAGKSTLMNMISGYITPSSGTILVNNHSVENEDLVTKKDIGFLPEGAPLYTDMIVRNYLQYFIELKLNLGVKNNLSKKQINLIYATELDRIIKAANIVDVADKKIETLSKGYVRRVGFAASLIGQPPILLLDEPTDGLDPNQKRHMCELIKEMSTDKTIVISTHLLDEAQELASKIILINKGKIVAEGSVKNILAKAKAKSLDVAFKILTCAGSNDNERY